MENYKTTIGLEVHAELSTKTKMFCNSKNDTEEKEPNVNICPICLAHPGTLPVINKEAVKSVLKIGVAVGGELADFTEFDRKNYFYPDIPKGYQITQYIYPLVKGGQINGVALTRIHLEEDTAKSSHEKGDVSLIDYNRAGVPLMELVTEPVIKSAIEASNFAKELQTLLQYLNVSHANMEKGEMRVEANISVSKTENFGTKVEVKNINSFKAVEKAIEFETKRQIELIENGGKVIQETRGWDENKGITFSQRLKESSHDYRYFPDPDLPKLKIGEIKEFDKEILKTELPELPWEKRNRMINVLGLKKEDVDVYIKNSFLSALIENIYIKSDKNIEITIIASNYITSDLLGLMSKDQRNLKLEEKLININGENFLELINMGYSKEISSYATKEILGIIYMNGGKPKEIAIKNNLIQKSDRGELVAIVEKVIEENKSIADEYKNGKKTSIQYLVGQGMKKSGGSANPKLLADIFQEILDN